MTIEEKSTSKTRSKIYVLTIQILFGIIIGISFTDYHNELVPFRLNFETVMIFVAFATVLLSLVGYSITIKYRHHKNFWRFTLDVFLLYIYYQLVYSPQNSFGYFLWIFPWIFGVYIVWQILEYREWKNDKENAYEKKQFQKTVIGTGLFFIGFLIIALWYDGSGTIQNITEPNSVLNYWPVTIVEEVILGGLILLLISFRVFIFKLESKTN